MTEQSRPAAGGATPGSQSGSHEALNRTTAARDWFLCNLVDWTNRYGIELGVTLHLGGAVVTGTLISGRRYFELFSKAFLDGFGGGPDDRDAFKDRFETYAETFPDPHDPASAEVERHSPNYIHLKDAFYISPGARMPSDAGVLWRGRIAEVAGFNLGVMRAARD